MKATIVFTAIQEMFRDDTLTAINQILEKAWVKEVQPMRLGTVSMTLLSTTLAVVFDIPFEDANYDIWLQPQSGVSVGFWASAKTATGFTMNVSLGVLATFSYLAIGKAD